MSGRGPGARARGNLPAEVTGFVGRAREVKRARALLATGRLVTLIGVGGVGKTRLALRVASQVSHVFADGVWLVELAEVPAGPGSTRLEQSVAEALGLRGFSAEQPREALVEHVRERHCLLVMDNCEHLVDEVGALVTHLLRASDELRVLATSRGVLGCVGEHVLHVPPLGVPDPDDPDSGSEAMQLLRLRAEAVGAELSEADSAAAGELCRRLDGLPLAIELAAGRLRALSIEDALERLDDRFRLLTDGPRHGPSTHRTLRQVMDWSYQLCSPAEQLLWQRVSVFAGGFDLAAAEQVCAGAEIDRADVLDVLTGLVRQSVLWVQQRDGHTRYRMLETLRQYGLRVLAECGGDVELRGHHRDYYRRLAARAAQDWFSPRELDWLRWVQTEIPNLRAAMSDGLSEPGCLDSLDIAVDLTRLRAWFFLGWPGEGPSWLKRGLDRVQGELDGSTRVRLVGALSMAAWVSLCQGDAHGAATLLRRGHTTLANGEDAPPVLRFAQGVYALLVEVDPRSVDMLAGVLRTLCEDGAAPSDVATVELFWAIAAGFLGDRDTALTASQQHFDNARQHGAVWQTAWAQWTVGLAQLRHGDHRRALNAARESLRRQRDIDDRWGTVWGTHEVAWALAARLSATRGCSSAADTRRVADTIARLLGGAQQLRDWAGVRLVGLGPFRAATAHAADVARETLGEHAYTEAFEQGGFPGVGRAQAYQRILTLAGGRADTPPPAPVDAEVTQTRAERLSSREQQVAALIARGWTNPAIARELVISTRTVQTHVANILRKQGLRNRHELAVWHSQTHSTQR